MIDFQAFNPEETIKSNRLNTSHLKITKQGNMKRVPDKSQHHNGLYREEDFQFS